MAEDLIRILRQAIETAGLEGKDSVLISRDDAEAILRMLSGEEETPWTPVGKDGRVQFYCMDCGKSFLADPREDRECFEKWQYHTWYAACPSCRREIVQTDRYWR